MDAKPDLLQPPTTILSDYATCPVRPAKVTAKVTPPIIGLYLSAIFGLRMLIREHSQ